MQITAWVVVDAHEGSLTRYQLGGKYPVKTHCATNDGPAEFTPGIVEEFRIKPHPDFYVGGAPPPSPFGGGTPVGMRQPAAA
jgi:hypothetical protein